MKNIFSSGVKKIIAGAMAAVTAISALPLQSMAEGLKTVSAVSSISFAAGQTVYSKYGDNYVPSDGGDVANNSFYYAEYDDSGNPTIKHHEATDAASRLLMANSPNATKGEYVICIEAGTEFVDKMEYTSLLPSSSKYWKAINSQEYSTSNADQYIALAMYYGLRGLDEDYRKQYVAGSNADDWVIATQVLVWEFQQGIRTGTGGGAGSNLPSMHPFPLP